MTVDNLSGRRTRARASVHAAARCGAAVGAAYFTLVGARAGAQDIDGPARQSPPRFVVAAGLDGFLRDGSQSTPQLALHAGYELRPVRGGRAGLRLGADYTTRRYGPTTVRINGDPVETIDRSGRTQVFGAVLLGTYMLASGPVRPYALAGGGLYGLTAVQREPASPVAAGGTQHVRRVSPALSGGLGFAIPVGALALSGEARVTYLSNGVGGRQPGIRGVVIPLVLGVQF